MSDEITLVSGLPRSGTSMMMKMLEAGGLPILTDSIRTADEDNPKGYYEFERVKKVKEDQAWLPDARGKVVKVISQLLFDMPSGYRYKVLFMRRRIEEILASQKEMLKRRGTFNPDIKDEDLKTTFLKHLDRISDWLKQQDQFDVQYISYNRMLENPAELAEEVNRFLGDRLDVAAMLQVVDRKLYRQRA